MAEKRTADQNSVTISCPKCDCENPGDAKFCAECGQWLVGQWDKVQVKERPPITMSVNIGPGDSICKIFREFQTKGSVRISLSIHGGANSDIVCYVTDPNGNVVAGSKTGVW